MLVDDQDLFRDIARSMLNASEDFVVVAEANDGSGAVDQYATSRPDLVLMDVQMAQMTGLAGTRRIVEASREAQSGRVCARVATHARLWGDLRVVGVAIGSGGWEGFVGLGEVRLKR